MKKVRLYLATGMLITLDYYSDRSGQLEREVFIRRSRKESHNLEGYCEEMKKALEKSGKPVGDVDSMPVCKEVISEGFLQIVSEARLSAKQFCKTLVEQIEETDDQQIDNLSSLLQPHKVSLTSSKYS